MEKNKLGERLVWRRISRDMDRFREGWVWRRRSWENDGFREKKL